MVALKQIKDKILQYFDWIMLFVVILLAISQKWIGALSLVLLYFGIVGFKVYRVFKTINPYSKNGMVADYVRNWETEQLGYDLDSDYWLDKKKPTLWQKFKGINPNWTEKQNKAWKNKAWKIKKQVKNDFDSKKLAKNQKVYK